ncbi:MAG: thiamine-phosphate kinase [Betaproteobacteria bacterium]|nr:thiamine-phosphate kinase [Betaproteobacteria bacterium]
MTREFDLIRRYFTRPAPSADLGVGDDCALMRVSEGYQLAVSTDMLVCDRHFFADVAPEALGHKTLAVNLSDMAAMGARPRWFTLALALPRVDESWLEAFARGLFALADAHGVDLVGGDTTGGPLNLCVQIMGEVPRGQALTRAGANPRDDIWVSGCLGDSALALAALRGDLVLDAESLLRCRERLERPVPRVTLGLALRGVASAAIDVSDGLLADLGHILERSAVGATVRVEQVPCSRDVLALNGTWRARCALAGGDDYELCFTAPPGQRAVVEQIARSQGLLLSRIGEIEAQPALRLLDARGQTLRMEHHGFDHFA